MTSGTGEKHARAAPHKPRPYKNAYSIALYDQEGTLVAIFDDTHAFAEYIGKTQRYAESALSRNARGKQDRIFMEGRKEGLTIGLIRI